MKHVYAASPWVPKLQLQNIGVDEIFDNCQFKEEDQRFFQRGLPTQSPRSGGFAVHDRPREDQVPRVGFIFFASTYSVRDATFIKFTLDVDKNQNHRNLPVVLQRKAFVGKVHKSIALTVSADFPARIHARMNSASCGGSTSRIDTSKPGGYELGPPSEVIDVESIDCLAGRIQDRRRWACLLRPEVAAKFKLIEEVGGSTMTGEQEMIPK
ncbi:hypothetical protein DFH07DRAFT_766236 [Mycena maculata]|uniref:Uncharacterized protein n=1 Tax=Mycena maculata TaxID=230809 RepID=A0AAD7K457_9AGAR|nr:hypothetical protein DFH07DRAFT_766236 [Mycena maculata]